MIGHWCVQNYEDEYRHRYTASVKDYKNRLIPKEVAVLSLDQNFTGHWIVSPNRQIITLCQEARKGAGQRGQDGQQR